MLSVVYAWTWAALQLNRSFWKTLFNQLEGVFHIWIEYVNLLLSREYPKTLIGGKGKRHEANGGAHAQSREGMATKSNWDVPFRLALKLMANISNRSHCWLWRRRYGWGSWFAFLRAILANFTQQKWSSCSWLLLQEFVKQYQKHEKEREEAIKAGILDPQNLPDLPLPKVSYVCPSSIQSCSMMTAENRERLDRSWLELTLLKVCCVVSTSECDNMNCLIELDRLSIIAIDVSWLNCHAMFHWPRVFRLIMTFDRTPCWFYMLLELFALKKGLTNCWKEWEIELMKLRACTGHVSWLWVSNYTFPRSLFSLCI